MIKISPFVALILFFAPLCETKGQGCCSAGTSTLGGVERGIAPRGTLFASVSYQYNLLDDSYESTRSIPDPLGRTADVAIANLELEYGLSEQVSIAVSGGYFSKARTLTVKPSTGGFAETVSFTGNGFGDLLVLGKYQFLIPTITSPLEVGIGGGAKIPVGRYRQENDGTRLSVDLQAGTGAADLIGWGYVMKSIPKLGLRFFGNVLYRYTGTNLDGYRFGDEVLVSTGSEYSLLEYLDVGLVLKGRIAQQDFGSGRLLQSTGGTMYSAVPNIVYREGNSVFRLFAQVPFYRNVNGIQLTLTRLVGMELQYVFDLSKESNNNKENKMEETE